ncbi:hypothetical protein PENANT_c077G10277 [Penicillium antarcticum]|uniref:glutathione-specific gamma-glutamylcyclotransferase n=1 Tax=Penicillium antarcticum TaxID=416450 RepID=A0A1V6PQK9_9EURO|nr:hypothetical protein PENANT_c077G10277 [Penicillium antarcticum]
MAATAQGHQVHPDGRTWKSHFPKGDLWVFGYGTDHRGTPEQPGRVVTVIERTFWETLDDPLAHRESESASTGKVWGAAYHIPASHAEEVHDYLDEREIDGYSAHYTPFHPTIDVEGATDSSPIICMVYIGQPSNPQFLREAARREPQDVAQVISAGHGLSGKNTEYLFLLEKALEGLGLGTADVHVTDLVKRVKAIEAEGLGEAEEKEAELEVTKSLEGASEASGEANGRGTIE